MPPSLNKLIWKDNIIQFMFCSTHSSNLSTTNRNKNKTTLLRDCVNSRKIYWKWPYHASLNSKLLKLFDIFCSWLGTVIGHKENLFPLEVWWKFRQKILWRYIKRKQHKFFVSYPFLGLFPRNSSSNKQSRTTLKKNGGHKTQTCKKKLSLELINEAMLGSNSDRCHGLETAT